MLRIALLTGVLLGLLAMAADAGAISAARVMQAGANVIVTGSITLLEPAECYVESTDRAAGIWVQADTAGFAVSDLVMVTGTMGVVDGERVIQSATLTSAGASCPIAPFAMRGSAVGGANRSGLASLQDWITYRIPGDGLGREWRVTGGAPNTGLLITTWGTVNGVCYSPTTGARWFQIDDGSGVICDYGDSGVIVYSNADVNEGDFVSVTGASSIETSLDNSTRLVRVVRPRGSEDVAVLQEPEDPTLQLHSDEFDGSVLDPSWAVIGYASKVSLTANPGWLTLTGDRNSPAICQRVLGDWDAEIKIRPNLPQSQSGYIYVQLSRTWDSVSLQSQALPLAVVTTSHSYSGGLAVYLGPYGNIGVPIADACWIRIKMRRPNAYISASTDGVSYCMHSDGVSYCGEYAAYDHVYDYLQICAYSSPMSFTPMIDYVRLARASE